MHSLDLLHPAEVAIETVGSKDGLLGRKMLDVNAACSASVAQINRSARSVSMTAAISLPL
ncbi:hypothetical protein U8Q07_15020 [Rhizobium ruizarguesonis]|nr:hypothetical protein U8Q07_15020 [Rhizobium ruizarguesonis]